MSKVALIRCENYEYENVLAAVKKGIDLIGGIESFAKPDEKILLKPNMLAPDPPEKCSTTNFMVFKAVAEVFKSSGAMISYGDSPGFGSPEMSAKRTGIYDAAKQLDIPLADFSEGREIFFKDAVQNKKFVIAKGVLESNAIISIPKLKTHGFAKMTGSIKNQFGCVPGLLKGEFHVKLPDANDFSQMLVDLNSYLRPRLYIMDGIMAMEGNGPRGGTPKKMNILLFSSDPIALDATVCRIIGLEPELVPTIKLGKKAGLGNYLSEEIKLLGEPIENFYDSKFEVNREPIKPFKSGGALSAINNMLVPKPYIIKEKCVKCGVCVLMCPVNPKAVDFFDQDKKNVPTYKYDRCIRCYCCQELCPEQAIELKLPLIRRIFRRKK